MNFKVFQILTFQKYILRSLVSHFLAIMTGLILLIWFSRAVGFINYITENGVEIRQFFYLFVLILPWMANYIVPVSLFIATLVCFSRFLANNEITILKASGLENHKIARAGFLLGLAITFFCYLNSFFLAPYANKQLRISRNQIYNNYANLTFNSQTFETFKKTTIYSQRREAENLYGIFIHNSCDGNFALTITATSGKLKVDSGDLLLYLKQGTLQRFNCETKKSEILTFDSYVFNLNESQKDSSSLTWKPNERYFFELFQIEEGISDSDLRKIRIEISQRILDPLMSVNLVLIAMSFLLRGSFKRNGNWQSGIQSIVVAVCYILFGILSFQFAEKFPSLFLIPYANCLLFFLASLFLLRIK